MVAQHHHEKVKKIILIGVLVYLLAGYLITGTFRNTKYPRWLQILIWPVSNHKNS